MNNRRNPNAPLSGRKLEREEDLALFRELHKREKDRVASLLLPVSEEFEPTGGNYALYRIASGKKGSSGFEFLTESNKNDYDWLKTPPATPLFPSLEMEANGAQLVVQRELPIIQPVSRFAGNNESSKARSNIGRPKSPNPKPKIPSRSITPSQRPSISSTETNNTKMPAPTSLFNRKTSHALNSKRTNVGSNTKPYNSDHMDFLTSNLSKSLEASTNKTKPRSRGVSPMARSTIPAQFQGFSDETPSNLKTDRSMSATRGRQQQPTSVQVQKAEPSTNPKARRQSSCSPSVTRGRRVEAGKQDAKAAPQTQLLGSRMVEKVMNARKASVEDRDHTKQKSPAAASIDQRTKHMEIRRETRLRRGLLGKD